MYLLPIYVDIIPCLHMTSVAKFVLFGPATYFLFG